MIAESCLIQDDTEIPEPIPTQDDTKTGGTGSEKVYTPQISPIIRFVTIKKEPEMVSDSRLVEQVKKSLHEIVAETRRWREIIYSEYKQYRLNTSQ